MKHFGVALGDIHCNNHNPWACQAIMQWGAEQELDSWAQLGDACSFDAGSVHPPDKDPEPYYDEIATQAELFVSFHDAFGKRTSKLACYYTPGNHERRWFRDVFNNSRFAGMLPDLYDVNGANACGALIAEPYAHGKASSVIRIEDTGNPDVPGPVRAVVRKLGDQTKRYGLTLCHGQWHSRNATRTHAERMFFGPTIHGHTHQQQKITADSWNGLKSTAYGAGWLGLDRESYQNRSDSWTNGFVTYYWDGMQWHIKQIEIVWDGETARFEYDGKIYQASKKIMSSSKPKKRKKRT